MFGLNRGGGGRAQSHDVQKLQLFKRERRAEARVQPKFFCFPAQRLSYRNAKPVHVSLTPTVSSSCVCLPPVSDRGVPGGLHRGHGWDVSGPHLLHHQGDPVGPSLYQAGGVRRQERPLGHGLCQVQPGEHVVGMCVVVRGKGGQGDPVGSSFHGVGWTLSGLTRWAWGVDARARARMCACVRACVRACVIGRGVKVWMKKGHPVLGETVACATISPHSFIHTYKYNAVLPATPTASLWLQGFH